jgi:hypothetical protein
LKQGYALSQLLFKCALEYDITKVQANQKGFQLNGTHQLLVYASDISIFSGRTHTIKKNTEAFVVASKEISLEVNVEKTTYMVMSGEQHEAKITR